MKFLDIKSGRVREMKFLDIKSGLREMKFWAHRFGKVWKPEVILGT
jgi:hypothetical protein